MISIAFVRFSLRLRKLGTRFAVWILAVQIGLLMTAETVAETNPSFPGCLKLENGEVVFPIGFYEMPSGKAELEAMASAGVNLVHCRNRSDLDRAHAVGLMGWISLNVQQGATEDLRRSILSVEDHPALSVWEGPDEIVWTFTAYSGLKATAGFTREDWHNQIPRAVRYARNQAATLLPKLKQGISLVRELDNRKHPFWINEAADSDLQYVRGYVDHIDITGCDYYAVRSTGTDLPSVGRLVHRWDAIGRGKPVWMVLQAFSWHTANPERTRLYPSFAQSRFMAYDSIANGAKGILYWGSEQIDDPAFRQSLYALTSELSAIAPILAAVPLPTVRVRIINDLFDPPGLGVRAILWQRHSDFLLVLVNEDSQRHLGVDVTGLDAIEGKKLSLLYGMESAVVEQGGFATRMQGHEVKVFTTDPNLASPRLEGRNYTSPPP